MNLFVHPHNINLLNQTLILQLMDVRKRRNTTSYDTEIREFLNESMQFDQRQSHDLGMAAKGVELIKKAPRDTWTRDEQKAVSTYEAMLSILQRDIEAPRPCSALHEAIEALGYTVIVDAFASAKPATFSPDREPDCLGVYVNSVEGAIELGQRVGFEVNGIALGRYEVIYPYTSGMVVAFRDHSA